MRLEKIDVQFGLLAAGGLDDSGGELCGTEQTVHRNDDFIFGHGLDDFLGVFHRVEFPEVQHLFRHADDALLRAVGTEVHASQNVRLGALEFSLAEPALQEVAGLVQRKFEGSQVLMFIRLILILFVMVRIRIW